MPLLPRFRKMAERRDLNDGKPWSEMDLDHLSTVIEAGWSIEHAARFLCRATNVPEVEAKARELGLPVRHE
jgi:hypothetical protein